MELKDFFLPTKVQIRTIFLLALIFAFVVPNFEIKGKTLFGCLALGTCTAAYAVSFIVTGFIIGWIGFYVILMTFGSLVRANFNKTKFLISLVISIMLVFYFTIIYVSLHDKVSVFYQPSFLTKFIILVASMVVFFMISYTVYSAIESIARRLPHK